MQMQSVCFLGFPVDRDPFCLVGWSIPRMALVTVLRRADVPSDAYMYVAMSMSADFQY